MASKNGEDSPQDIMVVRSTLSAAEAALMGDQPRRPEQAVWVIQMAGEFVGYMAKGIHGPNRAFPRGHLMTVVVDDDGGVLIWSIRNESVNLASLGRVQPLSSTAKRM